MATNLILTKESSDTEIRSYFKAILELSKSDNEFPVKLDEVWMLVYPRKDHAVRELRKTFIEGIDYQALPKNGEQDSENTWGGNNRNDYILTIPLFRVFHRPQSPCGIRGLPTGIPSQDECFRKHLPKRPCQDALRKRT